MGAAGAPHFSLSALTCADCGLTQLLPAVPPLGVAECGRCDRLLERRVATHLGLSFACSLAALALLVPAALLPFMDSTIRHLVFEEARLVTSASVIYHDVRWPFAFGFLVFAMVLPALRALLLALVLGSLRWGWRLPHRGRLFRWSQELRIWSMTDVVVVAGITTYFRASVSAQVNVLAGAWCYLAVALLSVVANRSLDVRAVWQAILPDHPSYPPGRFASCIECERVATERERGDACPRCGAELDGDLRRRFLPALVALVIAVPLTVPSYAYAVMVNDRLTGLWEHTVLGTVDLIAERGHPGLALVLLVAGLVVPVVEIVGLGWLLFRVWQPEPTRLVERTRAYRVLRDLVRWPMVIPFIAATATPIVNFPGIDDIIAGPGATPFFLLVATLMVAVRVFEPRMMWSAAAVEATA
jgi:paraquat-inducible protein A